jgi:hypothetical protein
MLTGILAELMPTKEIWRARRHLLARDGQLPSMLRWPGFVKLGQMLNGI